MADQLPEAPRASRGRSRAIAATALFVGLLSVGGWWAGRDLPSVTRPASRAPLGGMRLFDQVLSAVAQKYVDSLDAPAIYDKAVSGLLRELNDPYTAFLTAERLSKLDEQISGVYAGVGLQMDIRDNWPTVIEPIPGGPAERAGVQAGDRVVLIGGAATRGWTQSEVSRALRGPPESNVSFTIERGDQVIPLSIKRASVHRRAVPRVALLPGGIGYADVKVFSTQTATELRAAVDSLLRQGARARSHPSADVDVPAAHPGKPGMSRHRVS